MIDASATTQFVEKVNNISVVRCKPTDLPIRIPCAMSESRTELLKRIKQLYPTRNARNLLKIHVESHKVRGLLN